MTGVGQGAAERKTGRWLLRLSVSGGFLACTVAALFLLPLIRLAPNRLVIGDPLYAGVVLGRLSWPIVLLLAIGSASLTDRAGWIARAAAPLCLSVSLLLLWVTLGSAAHEFTSGRPSATRAGLASGSFLGGAMVASALAWVIAHWSGPIRTLAYLGIFAVFTALAATGFFDALSIAVEFRTRQRELVGAVAEHLALAAAALFVAAMSVALLFISRRTRNTVEQGIAGLQVVPAVALLGALVAFISALLAAAPGLRDLGLTALGTTPAVCGIAAYLLLPLWRGLRAALDTADPATVEAAEAVGLTRSQVLTQVRLPLGAAVLIGALRVAAVQGIGLTTLAALVGAGGLGRIVFEGMAQFAPDLILLGALPILALSLGIDSALSALENSLRST